MKTLTDSINSSLINPFHQIKKYFKSSLLREISGILVDPENNKAYRAKVYLTSDSIFLFVQKFEGKKNTMFSLEPSDSISLKTIDDNMLKQAVGSVSSASSTVVTATKTVKVLQINTYDFLSGISDISRFKRAGGSYASGYSKFIYHLGKKYDEEMQNLLSISQSILKGETPKLMPQILPGSHRIVSILQAYSSDILKLLLILGIVLGIIYKQSLFFLVAVVLFVTLTIGLLIADKFMKHL